MSTFDEGPREFDQAEFDAFRADPKRQALVDRILASLDEQDSPPESTRADDEI